MIQLHKSWLQHLEGEFEKEYMKEIKSFLVSEIKSGKTIYPHPKNIFNALEYCSLDDLKVVIIGQDPYHGPGQAHGLSFSVRDGIKVPPSLQNIYKEIVQEGLPSPLRRGGGGEVSGNLEAWAKQGILLLNSVLTVEAGKPASHSKIGWQNFTDEIIKLVSKEKKGVVFLLWGAFAIGKKELIDEKKHLVLTSPHPSPFSVHKGFFGNMHFLQCNEYLEENGMGIIEW